MPTVAAEADYVEYMPSISNVMAFDSVDLVARVEGFLLKRNFKDGELVKKGQLLLEFDIEAIKKEGYEIITPVIITNSDEFTDVETEVSGKVNQGDLLLNLR